MTNAADSVTLQFTRFAFSVQYSQIISVGVNPRCSVRGKQGTGWVRNDGLKAKGVTIYMMG